FTEELAIASVLIGAALGAAVAGRMADLISRKISLIITAVIPDVVVTECLSTVYIALRKDHTAAHML
ncbi:MAG: hypothetical protein DLM70_01830, partial [Chloroflexi bacterium]